MWISPAVFNLLAFTLLACMTKAALVNISIDDTYGDLSTGQKPIYQPAHYWRHSGGCDPYSCITSPSTSLAFDGTWTAAMADPDIPDIYIAFSFTGVSLSVFFILINNTTADFDARIMSTTLCNFTLDGNDAGTFVHHIDYEATWTVQYNATVFSVGGLSNSLHEFIISTTSDQQRVSYSIFDYAIYTVDIPDNSTTTSPTSGSSSTSRSPSSAPVSASSKVKIIIGCVVGSFTFAASIVAVVLFRRSGKKWPDLTVAVTPLNQLPRGNHGDVAMSNAHLPWENSIHNESRGSGILADLHSPMRPTLPDMANASATLVPFRRGYQPPHHHAKTRDEVRAVRQMEIHRRLQNAQQVMLNLTSTQTAMYRSGPSPSFSDGVRVRGMEESAAETQLEQIRQLRTEIEQLRTQLSSDWAQGLSDEPPPSYHLLPS